LVWRRPGISLEVKRRIVRGVAWPLAALFIVATVVVAAAPLRARAKAIAVLARSMGLPFPRPFAERVTVMHLHPAPHLNGDLYWPGTPAPGIVLVTGGDPRGKDDPRVIRVARSIAGAGRVVFVPQLALRLQTFQWSDVQRIMESVTTLRRRVPGASVGLLGLSVGGSFSLLAAEQPEIGPLAFVATFGAYHDILGVIQGITTGATTYGGRAVPWQTVPEARMILDRAAVDLAAPSDRQALAAALGSGDPAGLGADTRSIFDLLTNTDPFRTSALAAALPASFRSTLATFSPATALDRLRAPLYIMHSVHDPASPPTEAYRLHASVPGSRLIVLHYYQHVSPPGMGTPLGGYVADGWGAWRFVSWIMSAQE
jgi:pimeloyl-ACP methyl ester carboxylesterase